MFQWERLISSAATIGPAENKISPIVVGRTKSQPQKWSLYKTRCQRVLPDATGRTLSAPRVSPILAIEHPSGQSAGNRGVGVLVGLAVRERWSARLVESPIALPTEPAFPHPAARGHRQRATVDADEQ